MAEYDYILYYLDLFTKLDEYFNPAEIKQMHLLRHIFFLFQKKVWVECKRITHSYLKLKQ